MELIEQKLRDLLHNLLMGENSPNNILITNDILKYIKDRSKDIAGILTIEVELLDSFEVEASRHSRRLNKPFSGFENLKGSYKIISEHTEKCLYEDFQKRKSTFIEAYDLSKEKEEEDFRSKLMEIKRNLPLRLQEDNEKHMVYSLFDMKKDLKLNILNDKDIDEYAVFRSFDVIYDKTYKLELVLFNKKITSFPFEEIKLQYYKYYVPEEFEKLKYELGKYYERQNQKKHLSIIDFYISKFSEEINKQKEGSIKECFALINSELNKLHRDVNSYYGHPYKAGITPEKLVWTGSSQEFTNFFELLIDVGNILYKGEKDKYAIYTVLLNNIFIKRQSDLTIDTIMEVLDISIPTPSKEVEKCKLTWVGSRGIFAKEFKKAINSAQSEKSLFLYHEKGSLRAIAKKLYEIFQIENENNPGSCISEESLIQAFKG
jgi:hypothetical protein